MKIYEKTVKISKKKKNTKWSPRYIIDIGTIYFNSSYYNLLYTAADIFTSSDILYIIWDSS